jgi:hypothetical protein
LGLGIAEALVAQGAEVTVVARDKGRLAEVAKRLGVATICGDITDPALARQVLNNIHPSILVLNAGATPVLGPINELSWDEFNTAWEVDVKATFYWLQEVIRLPLPQGSRVIIGSSGAAMNSGSPLSGSYAGAKRQQWLMALYANGVAKSFNLGIHFQAIIPMQIIGETELGHKAAKAYAKRKSISVEALLAGFGTPLPPAKVGEHVVSILTDSRYETGVAFGLKGDLGIVSLDI